MITPEPPARDSRFALIEDLDPEAPATARRGRRWELALALLLVLGLAGLGGGQWWQQQAKLAAYLAGARAAAAHDWDAAGAAFAAAADYSDAGARRADARRRVTERNQQYDLATRAAAQHDWPHALQAVQKVEAIAPNFRDLATLGQQARQAVYMAALSGTVALRPHADPPGLYTYGPGGWQWLQGSDGGSRVLAFCPDSTLLIDAPNRTVPTGSLKAGTPDPRTAAPDRADRQVLVDSATDGSIRHRPGIVPNHFNHFLCTASGVWGSVDYLDTSIGPPLIRQFVAPATTLSYQPWDAPQPITPALPSSVWTAVNIAPDGRHLLVLENTGATPEGQRIRLYLADPAGSRLRLLADQPGTLSSTAFSPNGQYLLIDTYQILTAAAASRTVFLLDLATSGAPRALTSAVTLLGESEELLDPAATFVLQGPRAGQVLVARRADDIPVLQLLDPAHPDRPVVTIPLDNFPAQLRFVRGEVGSDTLLVGWQNSQAAADGASNSLALIDTQNHSTVIRPLPDAVVDLEDAWVRHDSLVYLARVFNTPAQQAAQILRSRPLADLTNNPLGAAELYDLTIPWPPPSLAWQQTLPWNPGPGLLAYTTASGDLHARTYDGTLDLLLESGVATLYAEP